MEKALYSLLNTLAPDKVYALRARQGAVAPFIVFQGTNIDEWRSINGPSGIAQSTMQIDCYDREYYDAKALAEQVRNLIDGFSDTVTFEGVATRFGGISHQSGFDVLDETDDPPLFRSSASYLITYDQ